MRPSPSPYSQPLPCTQTPRGRPPPLHPSWTSSYFPQCLWEAQPTPELHLEGVGPEPDGTSQFGQAWCA